MKQATSATANAYKNEDGMLDFDAVAKLQQQVLALIKKDPAIKPTNYFVISTKAKPIKYSAASHKKDDLSYLSRRATKVATRARLSTKAVTILSVLDAKDSPALKDKIKQAVAAINAHIKKIETVKTTITKKKGAIRDASNAAFEKALVVLKEVLLDGGVKESNIIESTGMFGKSVLVKLDATNVVSIGKSDTTKFNAAKKALTSTSSSTFKSESVAEINSKIPQKIVLSSGMEKFLRGLHRQH